MPQTSPVWRPASGGCGFGNMNENHTTPQAPIGTVITTQKNDGTMGEAIYLPGTGSTAAGASVSYNPATLTTGSGSASAIAIPAAPAGTYAWFLITRAGA
ncbi:MAG: hypothetical protein AAFR28_03600 [Pseudomonadota bacterium]